MSNIIELRAYDGDEPINDVDIANDSKYCRFICRAEDVIWVKEMPNNRCVVCIRQLNHTQPILTNNTFDYIVNQLKKETK